MSYPTILKALDVLRLAIIARSADADVWLDFLYFHPFAPTKGEGKPKRITAFGVREQQGKAKIDILAALPVKTIFKHHPRMLRRSLVYFTDEYRPYSLLLFHDQINGLKLPMRDESNRIDSAAGESDFWRYTKSILTRHRGIAKEKFPLYLKEIEFRYNHKGEQVFDRLCRFLVSFIPEG